MALPPGFVLEQETKRSLPPGFVLEEPVAAPAAQTQPQKVESNIFREIADIPINLASGVATGTRLITDLAGAGNPVSESIRGVEGFLQSILSAQAKADQQEVGRIMAQAEDMGVGAQVRAGLRAFMVSPLDFAAQGLGTIVPGVAAGIFAGIPGLVGYGVGSGVGLVKGAVFDAVEEALIEQGKSPEEARTEALEAQSYAGENLDMIALGGVFGFVSTRFGVQPALISKKLGDQLIKKGVPPAVARSAVSEAAAEETLKRGVLGNLGRTAAIEGGVEAAQAGQERFAQNLALQRQDMDVPLMRGVISSAVLEGTIGSIIGGGVGTVEAQRADTTLAERRAARGADPGLEVAPEGTAPSPLTEQTPLEIDDAAPVTDAPWAPIVAAQVETDSQTEFDRDTIIDNRGLITAQFGLEAGNAYARDMMVKLNERAQQDQQRVDSQDQVEVEQAESAGQSIAARVAAEQAAAEAAVDTDVAPTIEPEVAPTIEPDVAPAIEPEVAVDTEVDPTIEPEVDPTIEPEVAPTIEPKVAPAVEPEVAPTIEPEVAPTIEPEVAPTIEPEVAVEPDAPARRGPGRPKLELAPEQQEKRGALSTAADTAAKAARRVLARPKELTKRANNVLLSPKYASSFPTMEAVEAYSADPKAVENETKANITAGMAPEAAQKAANAKQKVFNELTKKLEKLRGQRVSALAEVMKMALDMSPGNKNRRLKALETLQDSRTVETEFEAAAREAGVDPEQFGRPLPAIPAKTQRAPTAPESQTEADTATDAEIQAEFENELDAKAQERLQKETSEKIDAVEKDKTLVSTTVLPEAARKETTGKGLFNAIAELAGATPFEKRLARILKRMTNILGTKVVVFTDPSTVPENIQSIFLDGDKVVTAGVYDPESGTIYLHSKEGGDIRTALHEGVHAVTVDMLDSYFVDKSSVPEGSQKAIEALLELMVSAGERYAQLKLSGRTSPELDAAAESTENFTNLKEFLSYGITTPALQRMLLGMPPVSKGLIQGITSGFKDLIQNLARMIGLPSIDSNALAQLLDLTGVVASETALYGAPYKASEISQAKAQQKQISSLRRAVALRSSSIEGTLKNQKRLSDFVSTFMRNPKDGVNLLLNAGKYVTGAAYRAMLRAADTNMLSSLAERRGIGMAARLSTIGQELTVYRSQKIKEASKIAKNWDRYVAKNPAANELLNNMFRLSTVFNILVYDVDTKSFVSLNDSIARDQEATALTNRVAALSQIANRSQPENAALTVAKKALADRVQSITDLFTDYIGPLRAAPNGDAAMDIYAQTQDKHRADLNEAIELMRAEVRNDKNIPGTEADTSTDKGRLMSGLNDLFADMKLLNSYSPLSRPGKFAVRVRDEKGKQIFNTSLETDAARDSFIESYLESNPTHQLERVNLGENQADNMRQLLQGDNKKLADLFKMLDDVQTSGPEAVVEIKDAMYQMYLATLPTGAARKSALHRTNDLGYDGDALRAFAINQAAIVNQLARLKYTSPIRNEVSAGREQVAGVPITDINKREMEAIVESLAERYTTILSPPKMGSAEAMADAVSRLGTRAGFLWMLTSMRSAAIQPTQLVIFGFGGLHAKYGAGKTAAMAAKYMGNFLTARALSRTQVSESGAVLDEKGEAAIRNSTYVNNSPIKDALQKAWDIGELNNTYENTRTASIMELTDARESELRQTGEQKGLSDAAKFGMNLVSAPIYHAERVSREVFFMSAFELEYAQVLARGLSGDAAIEAAAQTAMELTTNFMFDYSALNKPLFAKTWYGRNGYQFMTFQVQATAHIVINFYKAFAASGFTKAEKREAAIIFWDTMAMGALFSGVTGIFGYTAMVALLDGLRDALRPDVDDEDADLFYDIDDADNPLGMRSIDLYIRNRVLNKYFGPDSSLANFMGLNPEQAQRFQRGVEVGLPNVLLDWNMQASLKLDGLIFRGPDGRDRSSEDTVVNLAFDTILGPSASIIRNFAKGYDTMVDDGDILRGFEMMLPAVLREPMKAMRFATEGNVTRGGDELKPREFYTGWKVVGQALGFGSTEVAESQVSTFAARKLSDEIKAEKKAVYDSFEEAFNKYSEAVDRHGAESRQAVATRVKFYDVLDDVRRYNYKNFFDAIKPGDLNASLRERMRRQGITDEGFYLGDAVAPYLYRIVMPSRSVTNPPPEAQ